jgi:FtsZ-interacting cell division protein YlmF
MTKFSSFKNQQLMTESWRRYNNILEEQDEPVKPNTYNSNNNEGEEEEISKPAQKSSSQQNLAQTIEKNAKSSPFILMMNAASSQDQFFVLQQFLQKITIKDPRTFYSNLSHTALKLKDTKSQTTNPVQPVDKQAIKQQNSQQPVKPALEESIYDDATLEDGTLACPACLEELLESDRTLIQEAKYQGKTVTLNKPFLTPDGPKKRSVYVKNSKTGNVKKVSFGDPNMRIKKNIPARRKSFRARHKCDQKKDKTTSGYWSCKFWE